MKKISFLLFTLLFAVTVNAQPGGRPMGGGPMGGAPMGKLSGKVLDADNNTVIEYATIALSRMGDSKIIEGIATDSKGEFSFDKVPFGNYKIQIQFVGYQRKTVDSLFVSAKNPYVRIKEIFIKSIVKQLGEVEVVGEASMLQNSIDKKVYNVEKSPITMGGNASDVLQNIPSVTVDGDGNVALRGSGNFTVLIDGRPSGMMAANKAQALEQIPASSIQSVEVITNPSAKYDPDGMSGIINIVLKRNIKQGLNGTATLSAGSTEKYNASGSLGYRNNKINLFGNYSFLDNKNKGYSKSETEKFMSKEFIKQDGNMQGHNVSNTAKIGADYYINKTNTLGAGITLSQRTGLRDGIVGYTTLDRSLGKLSDSSFRDNKEDSRDYNMEYSLNYRKTFENPQKSLTADASYSLESEDETNSFINRYYIPAGTAIKDERNLNPASTGIWTLQTDYVQPMKGDGKFETGYKTVIRQMDNDFTADTLNLITQNRDIDFGRTNHFLYTMQTHAVYGIYSNNYKKFGYQAGLRAEEAITDFTLKNTNKNYKKNYFSLFPSMHVAYKVNEMQQLQLSYSRRVNRPSEESINPFGHYMDKLNIHYGNPRLKPEYTDAYELSYSHYREKYSATATVFYRRINDMITRLRHWSADSTTLITTFDNYSSAQNYGTELVLMYSPIMGVKLNGNFSMYESKIDGTNIDAALNSSNFMWTGRMGANITIRKGLDMQISGNYMSPMKGPQGTFRMGIGADGAIKKEILKGKGTVGFKVSDIFNSRKMEVHTSDATYSQDMIRRRDVRTFYINFSYRFGTEVKDDKPKRRQEENGNSGGDDAM